MFLHGGRSGSINPIQTITLGLLIFMFLGGAELFQMYVARQTMLAAARNIAAYGASVGRFTGDDPGDAMVINGELTKTEMYAYAASAQNAGIICPRCTNLDFTPFVHASAATTSSCVQIGSAATDYQFDELSSPCGNGKNWVTNTPSTAVLLTAELQSILPFWPRTTTIRAFGTASVYTNVPGGKDVFPWIPEP